jgi:integrase
VKPFNAWRRYWNQALEEADIDNFRFHDLRHTAASYLTQAGIPAITVAAILGHKTLQMTKRYSHLAVEHQREAVTKVFG